MGTSAEGETRNPKSEIRKTPEIRNPKGAIGGGKPAALTQEKAREKPAQAAPGHTRPLQPSGRIGFRISAFGLLSDFGFRISDFASPPPPGFLPFA
jgi:hypothetical protein